MSDARKLATRSLKYLPVVLAASLVSEQAIAQENPIDCEILICMAAGFPAASGCTPAFGEVVDRVTPWPVEPPLQIWNCPMNIPAEYGNYDIDLSSPEYDFATSFRVFEVRINDRRDSQNECSEAAFVRQGSYDDHGNFDWDIVPRSAIPADFGATRSPDCRLSARAVFIDWHDAQGTYSSQRINY